MTILPMSLSVVTGAAALAATARFAEKKVPVLGVIMLAISIATALVAGTITGMSFDNANTINQGDAK